MLRLVIASRDLLYIRYQSINQSIRSDAEGKLSVQFRFTPQSDLIDLTAALDLDFYLEIR
jgi:hypothetical protein